MWQWCGVMGLLHAACQSVPCMPLGPASPDALSNPAVPHPPCFIRTTRVPLPLLSPQPPPRLNALLRLVEGLASLRMLHKYGAASSLPGVVAVAIATQCMGWVVSALLRRRHARHLATDRRQDPRT